MMQLVAAGFDPAFVGKFAQHLFERNAICVFQSEGAGDFARANLTGPRADESEDCFLGRKGGRFLMGSFVQ